MRSVTTTPPAIALRPGPQVKTLSLELITSLCGGSATPHENDPQMLIRGSSLRGQLRFWWRACRAGQFKSTQAMYRAEAEIWGSEDHPAAVQVQVKVTSRGEQSAPIKAFDDSDDAVVPSYIAFPLTGKGMMHTVQDAVTFELTLRYPDRYREEVEAALWAFTHFGGLGGRTRRGFGAVQAFKGEADLLALEADLQDGRFVVQAPPPEAGIPSLYGAKLVVMKGLYRDAYDAWFAGIGRFKDFRQHRRPGLTPKHPGRSFWCEPDAIRRLRRQASAKHSQPVNQVNKYPRAVFGLPVLYQFKDGKEGEPRTQTLKPSNAERLASPLILRPLYVKGGQSACIALLLANSRIEMAPGYLSLNGDRVEHQLTADELDSLKQQSGSKLAANLKTPDVLASFLEYFQA